MELSEKLVDENVLILDEKQALCETTNAYMKVSILTKSLKTWPSALWLQFHTLLWLVHIRRYATPFFLASEQESTVQGTVKYNSKVTSRLVKTKLLPVCFKYFQSTVFLNSTFA